MADPEPVQEVLARWREGDQAAAAELHQLYWQRILELASGQINKRLRGRLGPDDIAQSVFRTFFRRTAKGEYAFDHAGALWQLLVQITLNKIRKESVRLSEEENQLA